VVLTYYHLDHAGGLAGIVAEGERTPSLHATMTTRIAALGGGPVAPPRNEALTRAFADVVIIAPDRPTRAVRWCRGMAVW